MIFARESILPGKNKPFRRGRYCSKGKAQLSGWLYKLRRSHDDDDSIFRAKRHLTLPWSRRLFTIERDNLKWYTNSKKSRVKGFINFLQILNIRICNTEDRSRDVYNRDEYGTYGFIINTSSRRLVLRAEDRFQAKNWILALRQNLNRWTGRSGRETFSELRMHSCRLIPKLPTVCTGNEIIKKTKILEKRGKQEKTEKFYKKNEDNKGNMCLEDCA